jgi:hypothetical protein
LGDPDILSEAAAATRLWTRTDVDLDANKVNSELFVLKIKNKNFRCYKTNKIRSIVVAEAER